MAGPARERRSDKRLRALVGATGEGFLAVSSSGEVRLLNEAASEMLGVSREQAIGRPVEKVGDPSLAAEIRRLLKRKSAALDRRFALNCGARLLSCRMVSYEDAEGTGVAATLRDDTELVRQRERSEAILASTGDGLVVFSPDGVVTYFNPAACTMLGVKPRKVVGKAVSPSALLRVEPKDVSLAVPCWQIKGCRRAACPAFKREELRCWLTSGTLGRDGWPVTFREKVRECERCEVYLRNAGLVDEPGMWGPQELTLTEPERRIVKMRMDPVIDADGDYVGCVMSLHDVTAEHDINQMKNEFVSTVSHELRTPLTSIKGYIDLILDGEAGEVNEIQTEFLGIVKENTDRLVTLINDLLDISRIESGRLHLKVGPLDVGEVVAGVIETFRTIAEQQGISLESSVPHTLAPVVGDRDRIGQVLMNLVSNALKYTVGGGGTVKVRARREGDRVIASVTDSGIGIPKEAQKDLFSKFYRVDSSLTRSIGGTGLGLSIAKSIVELLGGRIWVRSTPGRGSTFSFSLPVAGPEMVRTPEMRSAGTAGAKVLVVDREPQVADLIETFLQDRGYTVIKAHSGWDAVQKAVEERPAVITLDVMLEDVDGFELLQQLKDIPETASIPVLVLSIVCDEGRSCRLGAADYLEKPIEKKRLVRVIDDLVGAVASPKVLVVDDDRHVVEVLTKTLQSKGFAVASAYDGREAMAAVRKRRPDLVLLDLKMPEMDGYQVIQRLKTDDATKDIPIVVVTAHRLDRERTDLLKLTAAQVSKPFSAEHLVERLESMLRKGA